MARSPQGWLPAVRRSLGLRTQLVLGGAAVLALASVIAVAWQQSTAMMRRQAQSDLEHLASREAARVESFLIRPLVASQVMEQTLATWRIHGTPTRAMSDTLLTRMLAPHPEWVGTWMCFEPDAYDGQDARYRGQVGSDSLGEFIPYWRWVDGRMRPEHETGLFASEDDYYATPKRTRRTLIVEPYLYGIEGHDVLMTSTCVPLLDGDRVRGVVGIDLSLDGMVSFLSEVRPFGHGYAALIGAGGTYLSHPDTARLAKPCEDTPLFRAALDATRAGRPWFGEERDPATHQRVLRAFVPLPFDGAVERPWTFVLTAPSAAVLAPVRALTLILLAIGLISVLALGGLVIALVGRLAGPLREAAGALEAVADGDLSVRAARGGEDELGRMSTALAHAIASMRETLESVRRTGRTLETQTREMDDAARTLSDEARAQATSLERAVAALSTAHEHGRRSAADAGQATAQVARAHDAAAQARAVSDDAVTSMEQIQQASRRIHDITDTIDSLSFQTNLLSLNASIEAARAGEQGRGFAVVAAEVRALAQRSASASHEIRSLIEDAVQRIEDGTHHVHRSGEVLGSIVDVITEVQGFIARIEASVREQAAALAQVQADMERIDGGARTSAEQTDRLAAALHELSQLSREGATVLERFRLDRAA